MILKDRKTRNIIGPCVPSRERIIVSDEDIQAVEEILLPDGCHFEDDACEVIKTWKSLDVSACPGSGKTTVLLAKLKLLADRLPFEDNSGICVLSHTNVAVDEIKKRLEKYDDKLRDYPNYIGTIQSFIDKYVTMPYLKRIYDREIQFVDDRTYALHLLRIVYHSKENKYSLLSRFIDSSYKNRKGGSRDKAEFVSGFYLSDDGALRVYGQNRLLAGADKPSVKEFRKAIDDMIKNEGLIKYKDAYKYADDAVAAMSSDYTDLFSRRFRYVFVDEYQDCIQIQRDAIEKLFNRSKSTVMHIGDPDQSIYMGAKENTKDWIPNAGYLPISSSCRFGQDIANVLSPLKKDKKNIRSSKAGSGFKPVLIVFSEQSIGKVVDKYISILEESGLNDPKGIYKAVGFIQKGDTAGISIGDYWHDYVESSENSSSFKYWSYIKNIADELQEGKLYKVEKEMRGLLCRLFHYAGVIDSDTGREFTVNTLKTALYNEYSDIYTRSLLELTEKEDFNISTVDGVVRELIAKLINRKNNGKNLFDVVPKFFMTEIQQEYMARLTNTDELNVIMDPISGRRIEFATVHSVKGQTHDSTLYLETELKKGSDLGRILCYYGVGDSKGTDIEEYSRKIVYVGMSRPRKLLCVAMQKKTYEKSGDAFKDWTIYEI